MHVVNNALQCLFSFIARLKNESAHFADVVNDSYLTCRFSYSLSNSLNEIILHLNIKDITKNNFFFMCATHTVRECTIFYYINKMNQPKIPKKKIAKCLLKEEHKN